MKLFHLTTEASASRIEASGFVDETGTYKLTGIPLTGVFFSADVVDSNKDEPGDTVFTVDLDESAISMFEILDSTSDHKKFSVPAAVANSASRSRLTSAEAATLPYVPVMSPVELEDAHSTDSSDR